MRLAQQALEGSQAAGARLIRLLEEGDPRAVEELKLLYPHGGRAHILGITGPPGSGKSSLVDAVISALRGRGMSVGVIAIDPTSPYSGGAILGDRVRMQRHATDEGVFVRSMATRGWLGGLSRAAFEAVLVLDAMGYDVVVVETVGVGQDEVEVVDLAHSTVVLSIPGMGDDIQAMKAGVLEIGDLFVVNKSDKPGADAVVRQLRMMLEMRGAADAAEAGWRPQVLETVAVRGDGVAELVDGVLAHRDHLLASGELARKVQGRDLHFFRELVKQAVSDELFAGTTAYRALVEELKARRVDPYTAAEKLTARLRYAP